MPVPSRGEGDMMQRDYNHYPDIYAARLAEDAKRGQPKERGVSIGRMVIAAVLLVVCFACIRELQKPMDGGKGIDGHKMQHESKGRAGL
jgi:hypothetical protein